MSCASIRRMSSLSRVYASLAYPIFTRRRACRRPFIAIRRLLASSRPVEAGVAGGEDGGEDDGVHHSRGMSLRGSSDPPAVTPTNSAPWKENPAIMNTLMTDIQPPTNGASPIVQLLGPGAVPPMMPKIISTPRTRKASMAVTLIAANQNPPSPKALDVETAEEGEEASRPHPRGAPGNQKDMMTPAATSSAARVIAQLKQ